jgi:hypothetical protein
MYSKVSFSSANRNKGRKDQCCGIALFVCGDSLGVGFLTYSAIAKKPTNLKIEHNALLLNIVKG